MGQVAGDVVAAAFAVFNPAVVVPLVELGWQRTDAATICEARTDGAVAQLRRILGDAPEGVDRAVELLQRRDRTVAARGPAVVRRRAFARGPAEPLAAVWRLGDRLREYRGDSHTMAWGVAGFDATEIGLLTELYWGLPMRSYRRTGRGSRPSSTPRRSGSGPVG